MIAGTLAEADYSLEVDFEEPAPVSGQRPGCRRPSENSRRSAQNAATSSLCKFSIASEKALRPDCGLVLSSRKSHRGEMVLYKYLTPARIDVLEHRRIRFTQPVAFNVRIQAIYRIRCLAGAPPRVCRAEL